MSTLTFVSAPVTPRPTGMAFIVCQSCALIIQGNEIYATREDYATVQTFLDSTGALDAPVPHEAMPGDYCECCGRTFGTETFATGSYYGAAYPAR